MATLVDMACCKPAIMIGASIVKLGLFLYCRTARNYCSCLCKGEAFEAMLGVLTLLLCTLLNSQPLRGVTLIGQSGPPEVLQKLAYLVLRHPQIRRVDTVRAYTFGVLYFVEVGSYQAFEERQQTPLGQNKVLEEPCCSSSGSSPKGKEAGESRWEQLPPCRTMVAIKQADILLLRLHARLDEAYR
ncbi:Metal tolerance protein 4-like protein [Drosera capensis]